MWLWINLITAALALKGAFNKCLVSTSVVFCCLILAIQMYYEVSLSGVWSFAVGSMLYSLPCIMAFSTKFTKKKAFIALSSAALMLLELVAMYLYLIDSYPIVGLFYRPAAVVLYSLLAIACFWGSNGDTNKRNGSYTNWHQFRVDHRQTDFMGFERGSR